ncbi:AAA family ATPase [bacterium]|nr:AAA family ATPase [bacterium]
MILNNIMLENFRCYYTKNEIELNSNGKITLIYGDSGYGKSSLLQFFRWMFYGDPDFGNHNDKPLFNLTAFSEKKLGETLSVSGKIEFEHLGIKYCLTKILNYKVAITAKNTLVESSEQVLQVLEDNDWKDYTGDIANKINAILPNGLSKYFFLDGEKARELVLNSNDLKKAIHSLFGIDVYANALSHVGNKSKKSSVLGYYTNKMASEMNASVGDLSVEELTETIQELYDEIEAMKEKRKEIMAEIESKDARRDEIFKVLGESSNKNTIKELIERNNSLIKQCQEKIKETKRKIGDLYYKCYPYLLLSRMTTYSSEVLRKKNSELAKSQKSVFENLKKELLKEIQEKGICVCGRELDEESCRRIEDIINIMPPDSYTYQFGQFVSRAKRQIRLSNDEIMKYSQYVLDISNYEKQISDFEANNNEKFDDLKRLEDASTLVEELERIKTETAALNTQKSGYEGKIAKKKQVYEMSRRELSAAMKNSKVSTKYKERIQIFEEIKTLLEEEKKQREKDVRHTLNKCVREIFKQLTTQTELDIDKIQFVNDDFSLRTTYLTGGQLAVDEYSYVIGIIKALQECNMENNESPIIIDAPFAFTGNKQSEHIFKTLPTVSKQTVLLTLDLNKIKNVLDNKAVYDLYVIDNESQEKASIIKGDVNEFNF